MYLGAVELDWGFDSSGEVTSTVTSLILALSCELEHPPEESTRNPLPSLQVGGHVTGLAGKSVFGYF